MLCECEFFPFQCTGKPYPDIFKFPSIGFTTKTTFAFKFLQKKKKKKRESHPNPHQQNQIRITDAQPLAYVNIVSPWLRTSKIRFGEEYRAGLFDF